MIFILVGLVLLFSFGCPGEETPASPEPESPGEIPQEEEPAPEAPEEVEPPEAESPSANESGEEEVAVDEEPAPEAPEEEPVEEAVCVPIATDGYIEIGVYEGNAKYYYEGTEVSYHSRLEIGKSLRAGDGEILLEAIIINGTCEECYGHPSWTYEQMAQLRISVPPGEDEVRVVRMDQNGSFVSSYRCKTLDWDGKTCREYVPDEELQYYLWRVVADKTCVPENGA